MLNNLFCFFVGQLLCSKADFFRYTDFSAVMQNVGLVLFGAVLAFFLEFSEFLFLANTSSLTLSIAGIFKVCFLKSTCYMGNLSTVSDDILSQPLWYNEKIKVDKIQFTTLTG